MDHRPAVYLAAVDPPLKPPHEHLGVELLGSVVAKGVAGTPFRQAEDERAEVLASLGQLVAVVGAPHEAGSNQLT
jgi:hypothetical protein